MVNTRQYRAPEVQLQCCVWGTPSDMWGVGCIALEMYTGTNLDLRKGHLYFQTRKDEQEHLAMMIKAAGPIPRWMGLRAKGDLKSLLLSTHSPKEVIYDWPQSYTTKASVDRVNEFKTPKHVISQSHRAFRKLIEGLLTINPDNRLSA